ncbi:D-2-hydroxyacid dehydrogenase [Halobacteriaceae archaeon GCM10025711]
MDIDRVGIHESVSVVFPPEQLQDELSSVDAEVSVVGDDVADLDALVTFDYEPSFLDGPGWIHSIQAGYDKFPLDELDARDVVLTNSSGIHGPGVGETGVGLMLMLARNLHTYVRNQENHEWDRPTWDRPFTLAGKQLCVVGLGTLGQGIATRADAIGMDVSGVRTTPTLVPGVSEVYTPDRLHEAVADADFVAVTVPLTEETEGMFGPEEFAAMRDDAYFVNVARGKVVQEDALVEALETGGLAGAALDVFEEEPLPADSPLWDMEEVIVTPHASAATVDYYRNIANLVRRNVDLAREDGAFVNRIV